MAKLKLTQSQEKAKDELFNIIFDYLALKDADGLISNKYINSENFALLNGAAGTGKTTIIQPLITELKENIAAHFKFSCCTSAPTHKACQVIASKTKVVSLTIHTLLGLVPNYEVEKFDISNVKFTSSKKGLPVLYRYDLVIVDEASMVNKQLRDYLVKLAASDKIFILFVGDEYQLPPVGEITSSVFSTKRKVTLIEPVRQSMNNPLMLLLCALRYDIIPCKDNMDLFENAYFLHLGLIMDVKKGKSLFSQVLAINPMNVKTMPGCDIGFETVDAKSFALRLCSIDYKQDKCLSYTRESVANHNSLIRDNVIKHDGKMLVVGDTLIAYKNMYTISSTHYGSQYVFNSKEYVVTKVTHKTDTSNMITEHNSKVRVPIDYWEVETSEGIIFSVVDKASLKDYARIYNFYLALGTGLSQ